MAWHGAEQLAGVMPTLSLFRVTYFISQTIVD
jgi:hypothetical protein